MNCGECKGTGWVELFTSRERCSTCAGRQAPREYTVPGAGNLKGAVFFGDAALDDLVAVGGTREHDGFYRIKHIDEHGFSLEYVEGPRAG